MKEKQLLEYFLEINKIKDVKRYVPHHPIFKESVADHAFMMIVLADKFMDELKLGLDYKKVIKLITHHDFCEIGLTADYDAVKANADKNYNDEKEVVERKSIEELSGNHGKEISDLYTEYCEQKTQEAKFVKAIDKLETVIYELMRGAKYLEHTEFEVKYPRKAIENFPELKPFYRELLSYMKLEYTRVGHPWKKEYEL